MTQTTPHHFNYTTQIERIHEVKITFLWYRNEKGGGGK